MKIRVHSVYSRSGCNSLANQYSPFTAQNAGSVRIITKKIHENKIFRKKSHINRTLLDICAENDGAILNLLVTRRSEMAAEGQRKERGNIASVSFPTRPEDEPLFEGQAECGYCKAFGAQRKEPQYSIAINYSKKRL